jgi:hypothetical protein
MFLRQNGCFIKIQLANVKLCKGGKFIFVEIAFTVESKEVYMKKNIKILNSSVKQNHT